MLGVFGEEAFLLRPSLSMAMTAWRVGFEGTERQRAEHPSRARKEALDDSFRGCS
jgi:hypothetical protein